MDAQDLIVCIVEQGDNDEIKTYLELTNDSEKPIASNWRLYFSLGLRPKSESPFDRVMIEGRYGYLQPNATFEAIAPGDTLRVEIENWLFSGMELVARQGFHLTRLEQEEEVLLGEPQLAPPRLQPLTRPRNAMIKQLSPSQHEHSAGETTTANQTGTTSGQVAATEETIPAIKEYARTDENLLFNGFEITADDGLNNEVEHLASLLGESYRSDADGTIDLALNSYLIPDYELTCSTDGVVITGRTPRDVFYGVQTLRQLMQKQTTGYMVPNVQISDTPDFEHRALYIDLARHFQPVRRLKAVIRAMATYKLNKLILGVANDEGWRLEIPDIPELTSVGSRRAHKQFDLEGRRISLAPAWGDNHELVEGAITASEFISLLSFAATQHVEIIVELNTPAHANALLRSTQNSTQWRLQDPLDESTYQSAQGYSSNVLNVAMEDNYRIITVILNTITEYYRAAGVPMKQIHFGGDEVPAGAWLKSPACHALSLWNPAWDTLDETDRQAATAALMGYHYERVQKIANKVCPGTETGFWHEMAPFGDTTSFYNAWLTESGGEAAIRGLLDREQDIVICNASYLYLDMPYAMAADEPGLPWANYVDESCIYHFDPMQSWQIEDDQQATVRGLQAQLWTETVFRDDLMDYYLFPRLLAVAERAWNKIPVAADWPLFERALSEREIPYLHSLGIKPRAR